MEEELYKIEFYRYEYADIAGISSLCGVQVVFGKENADLIVNKINHEGIYRADCTKLN
jgi:hypothetical protein